MTAARPARRRAMEAPLAERPILVIKIGSSSVVDRGGRLDPAIFAALAAQLAEAARAGWRPVVVSSGAVAGGMGILGLSSRPDSLSERQALAAIGQPELMRLWQEALSRQGLVAAQLLLTNDDFSDRRRWLNLSATLRGMFGYGAVPVVNENDTVAIEELTVGDNDRLSALLATQLGARLLVLLTDIDGVYDADPRTHPQATLLRRLDHVPAKLLQAAGGAGKVGRGGMRSKLEAARLATAAGVETVIAPARERGALLRVIAGDGIGTRVAPRPGADPDARRRWVVARHAKGRVLVDAGAARALLRDGRSLLPAGIAGVEGRFARGDTVAVLGPDGEEIARGLASLSAEEMESVRGKRLDVAARALGYALPKAAVHRDDMLVLRHAEPPDTRRS